MAAILRSTNKTADGRYVWSAYLPSESTDVTTDVVLAPGLRKQIVVTLIEYQDVSSSAGYYVSFVHGTETITYLRETAQAVIYTITLENGIVLGNNESLAALRTAGAVLSIRVEGYIQDVPR